MKGVTERPKSFLVTATIHSKPNVTPKPTAAEQANNSIADVDESDSSNTLNQTEEIVTEKETRFVVS
jgi:hypothetical protein